MDVNNKGKLIWITGLSGAGKTSIGSALYSRLKEKKDNIVFLDGDALRQVYNDVDYTKDGRYINSFRASRMCKMLTDQNIDVICCIIAMYEECREWNRSNIADYNEIYLDVSIETLIKRDQKQLYSKALRNEVDNVLGINAEYEAPQKPLLTIFNEGNNTPDEVVDDIIKKLDL